MGNRQKLIFYKAWRLADMLETWSRSPTTNIQNMALVAQTCAGIEPNYVLHFFGIQHFKDVLRMF